SKRSERISASHGHQTYLILEHTQNASTDSSLSLRATWLEDADMPYPIVVAQFKCMLLSPPSFSILDLIVPNDINHLPTTIYRHYRRMLDNIAQTSSIELRAQLLVLLVWADYTASVRLHYANNLP